MGCLEFLAEVLSLLDRLTTPGRTLYMLNCGNANAPEIVGGHPRLHEATIRRAMDALALDYQPMTDMRASAQYRLLTAQNLLLRYLHDVNGLPTNLHEVTA